MAENSRRSMSDSMLAFSKIDYQTDTIWLNFLERNNMLYQNGAPILDNATLFALTLLIASSKPEEKDTMKQVILSVLNGGVNNY